MNFSSPCNEVVTALGRVQALLGGTLKPTRKVQAGSRKYEYIELDAILTAALPVLEANGLTVFHSQELDGVDCFLMHTSGQWICAHAAVPVGPDMSAQDVGSAFTYARRYSLTALFALAASDDDGAAATEARKNAKAGKKGKAKEEEPAKEPDVAVPWDDAEREAKFYATLEAGKVALTYPELTAICAEAGRPPPHKMDDTQLAKFTAYIIREHGSKAA